MTNTSRHPACSRARAVRQISRFVFLTAFTSESVVSPNGSGLTSIRRCDRESARATLVRPPRFSGVGFLFILFSQAIEERHFMKREISRRPGLERSSGDPCDAELSSANNPRQEVHRDQANQWTEHCESNSDARNYRSGKLLVGRARNALQTQLPPPGIELRNRS